MQLEPIQYEKVSQWLLRKLGITANYRGFHYISHAMYLISEDEERLFFVTKLLYPDIAKAYHTDWRAVEHSIRTVIKTLWRINADFICFMADYDLQKKPAAGKFLAIFYTFLLNLDIDESSFILGNDNI